MPEGFSSDTLHNPVVQHMRKDFVQLRADQTVEQALDSIRTQQPEGRIIYFYINDEAGRLVFSCLTRTLFARR